MPLNNSIIHIFIPGSLFSFIKYDVYNFSWF